MAGLQRCRIFLAFFLSFCISTSESILWTWYVAPTAAIGNDGTTPQTPFSLDEAMTAAAAKPQPGDQVVFELLADFDFGGVNLSSSYGFSSPAFNNFTVRAYGGLNITFMCNSGTTIVGTFLWSFKSLGTITFQDINFVGCPGFLQAIDVGIVTLTRVSASLSTSSPLRVMGNYTQLVLTDSEFINNVNSETSAGLGWGGAVYASVSSASISGSVFNGNKAPKGGTALYLQPTGYASQMVLSGVVIANNRDTSDFFGAAIYLDAEILDAPSFSFIMDKVAILQNQGYQYNGVFMNLLPNQNISITNSIFQDNSAVANDTGGLKVVGINATLTLSNTSFIRNAGKSVGALSMVGASLQMTTCYFKENAALYEATGLQMKQAAEGSYIAYSSFRYHQSNTNGIPTVSLQGALNGTSVTAEHLDISFNQGVGLIADQLDLDMSYTTIWTNTDTGLICSASDIDAANSVSVHNNDLSQYPDIKGLIQETICKDSCVGLNVSGTDFCSIACNVSLDVCSECAGNQTRMQLCFPPDPNRKSFYTLPTVLSNVGFQRPPLGAVDTQIIYLENGQPTIYYIGLQPVALRYQEAGSPVEVSLTDGVVAQGVPINTVADDGSFILYFDYRRPLDNGATFFLEQTLVSTQLLENQLTGTPSFYIGSNNLKMTWRLDGWPLPYNGTVELVFNLNTSQAVGEIEYSTTSVGSSYSDQITFQTADTAITVSLLQFSLYPTTFNPITNLPTSFKTAPILVSQNLTIGSNLQTFIWTLPNISASTVIYDPDFGVVLSSSSGTGPDLLYLLLILLLIPAAALIVVVVTVVGFVYGIHRKRRQRKILTGLLEVNLDTTVTAKL